MLQGAWMRCCAYNKYILTSVRRQRKHVDDHSCQRGSFQLLMGRHLLITIVFSHSVLVFLGVWNCPWHPAAVHWFHVRNEKLLLDLVILWPISCMSLDCPNKNYSAKERVVEHLMMGLLATGSNIGATSNSAAVCLQGHENSRRHMTKIQLIMIVMWLFTFLAFTKSDQQKQKPQCLLITHYIPPSLSYTISCHRSPPTIAKLTV